MVSEIDDICYGPCKIHTNTQGNTQNGKELKIIPEPKKYWFKNNKQMKDDGYSLQ